MGISPELAWERARGIWRLHKKRALAVREVEVIDRAGVVLAVAHVEDLEEFGSKHALVGTVVPDHPRVGHPSPYPHPYRNAIGYHQVPRRQQYRHPSRFGRRRTPAPELVSLRVTRPLLHTMEQGRRSCP